MVRSEANNISLELIAKDVTVSYGAEVALQLPLLNVHGKIIAIIGHNGSGKSTLIKTVLGLLPPRNGEIHAYAQYPSGRFRLIPEQHMAFSPENGAVFADVSVESYIKLWCRIKHHQGNYYRREGSHYVERLDVAPLLRKLGRELSKGQRRRVQSLVGFLSQPKLFLFDEPFDGLDLAQSNILANIMSEESANMAMVVSSHRMEVVERLADLIVVLDAGRVVTYGRVEEVCSALCGHSILLSHNDTASDWPVNALIPALRSEFYSCLVNHIGNQISITGIEINIDSLVEFLRREQCEGVNVKLVRPSLVDAMQYHLKKLH